MNLNNVATELARGPQNKLGPSVPPPACESSCVLKSRAFVSAGLAPKVIHRNLSPAELYEMALTHEKDTLLTETGALAARSGEKTGRSPKDKRVVREPTTEKDVWWAGAAAAAGGGAGGSPNFEMDERQFLVSRESAVAYLNSLPLGVFVVDGYANWDNAGGHRVKVRVVAERPYHALFMRNMLIRPSEDELASESFGEPDLVIFNAGHLAANRFGTGAGSRTCVALNLKCGEMVILGTEYAGEMKKGVFTYMHYAMPKQGVLSLHSGCNVGSEKGDVTLFFGLSGTGKTTLSTDPRRPLVGDDEHCWADDGVTNIEGGCYAKTIGLRPDTEPEIFNAVRFGAILENVAVDPHTREVDYSSSAITENTRACYPIEHIPNARVPCRAGHPRNIVLLCCDARGVLPPVARLSLEQAMYHFISGYTSKVAGTEMGVTEPEATFSACYGGAFLVWHPMKYAAMLAEKMERHGARAWLVNTGWCGGGAADGSGAKRVPLKHTRAIVDAIHSGALDDADFSPSPIFGLQVPHGVPSVPDEWLDQRVAWRSAAERRGASADEAEGHYRSALEALAELFVANFNAYLHDAEAHVGEALAERILSGGPDRAWATAHGGHGLHDD